MSTTNRRQPPLPYQDSNSDRISSLPGDILLKVISFLPLKEMVKTSILSNRWLNLWVNTPVLDFDIFDLGTSINMKQCVNHVLHQHEGVCLNKFRICCNFTIHSQEDIDKWVDFAFSRNTELFQLHFWPLGFLIPGRYFGSTRFGANYVLNPYCCFSSSNSCRGNLNKFLKSLSLSFVDVTSEGINSILRNCPFLERLEFDVGIKFGNLVISDPTLALKYLRILDFYAFNVLSISNFNLVSLDTTFKEFTIKDLPLLVELSITGRMKDTVRRTLSQNASCLCQLETLKLNTCKLEMVTELFSNIAQLTKLKLLVIDYTAFDDATFAELVSTIRDCNCMGDFALELHWSSLPHSSDTTWKVEKMSSFGLKLLCDNVCSDECSSS